MAFRTVIVENRCKLDYSLNYLVCRKDNEETKVLLDEIKVLLINSLQVSITSCLMAMLIDKKIKVILIDTKHNPSGEIVPYQNNFYSYRKIKDQIAFKQEYKDRLWREIIRRKIHNQSRNLKLIDSESALLLDEYERNVLDGDTSNKEGHSAKVYFNSLFGKSFNRDQDNEINKYLDYGYSIILSIINREIKVLGYLTEIGIHHIGESNSFNFSCDLVEPLRPLIDYYVINKLVDDTNFKQVFVSLLGKTVFYNGKKIFLDNAIRLYVEDAILFLKTGDEEFIRFIDYGV